MYIKCVAWACVTVIDVMVAKTHTQIKQKICVCVFFWYFEKKRHIHCFDNETTKKRMRQREEKNVIWMYVFVADPCLLENTENVCI